MILKYAMGMDSFRENSQRMKFQLAIAIKKQVWLWMCWCELYFDLFFKCTQFTYVQWFKMSLLYLVEEKWLNGRSIYQVTAKKIYI